MSKLLYARVITSGAEHIKPDDIKQHFTLIYEREDQGAIQSGQDEEIIVISDDDEEVSAQADDVLLENVHSGKDKKSHTK